MLDASELLVKYYDWMQSTGVSEEDSNEVVDVVKALRKASE
jgi:hypothetical protein